MQSSECILVITCLLFLLHLGLHRYPSRLISHCQGWCPIGKFSRFLHKFFQILPPPAPQDCACHFARLTRGEADRETYRQSAVPPDADKKAQGRLGQQLNSSFEADLVMDMVNHLSKVGGIILCWINLWLGVGAGEHYISNNKLLPKICKYMGK